MNNIKLNVEYEFRWKELQALPNELGKEILEQFISDYEWLKEIELTEAEAIELLEEIPMKAEYTEYGIHGVMAHICWNDSMGRCMYWQMYDKELFKDVMIYEIDEEDNGDYPPDEIYVCNECDETHWDYTEFCEQCGGDVRVVAREDLGYY